MNAEAAMLLALHHAEALVGAGQPPETACTAAADARDVDPVELYALLREKADACKRARAHRGTDEMTTKTYRSNEK